MKSCTLILLLCLALGLSAPFCRAQTSVPTPLAAAITQLDTDLLAIPAGSTVTDAQHQTIVTDLNVLAVGVVPAPAAADVDSIATALGNAAVTGNVTADALVELNADLAADATDADDWTDDITDDAATLLSPAVTDPDPIIIDPTIADPDPGNDPTLPIETAVPIFVTAVRPPARRTHRYHNFEFDTQNGQSPSNQFYYGSVGLTTRQVDGAAPVSAISVRAVGLPTNNPYTVNVTRKSDGAVVPLGQFNVQPVSSLVFNEYLTAATPDGYTERVENLTLGQTTFGGSHAKKALPMGVDARDVATVTLTDATGVARLSGHPGLGVGNYRTRGVVLHLSGDPVAAPAASAVAKANHTVLNVYTFYLSAQHLPVNMPVMLVADGVTLGQFTTGAHGRLVVTEGYYTAFHTHAGARLVPQKLVPAVDLSRTKSLVITDVQGNVLLSNATP